MVICKYQENNCLGMVKQSLEECVFVLIIEYRQTTKGEERMEKR